MAAGLSAAAAPSAATIAKELPRIEIFAEFPERESDAFVDEP
jgi:hypothetical protein